MKNNLVSLGSIAVLSNGVNLRKIPENEDDGDVFVIQYKNIDFDNESINLDGAVKMNLKRLKCKNDDILKPGDLLFTGSGNRNKAINVPVTRFPMIATHHFIVIRSNASLNISSEYLALFINHSDKYFNSVSQGTIQQNISKENLLGLEIQIPSLELQKNTSQLQKLVLEEKKLLQELSEKRKRLMQGIFETYNTHIKNGE